MNHLQRFIRAQQGEEGYPSYTVAQQELAFGQKRTHWIWYIFPQLKGLGSSHAAQYFGIESIEEAYDFLHHEELYKNYAEMLKLVLQQLQYYSLDRLMGGAIDAQKLVSSITLFRKAAISLVRQGDTSQDYSSLVKDCDQIFTLIASQGYSPCRVTLQRCKIAQATIPMNQITRDTPIIKNKFFDQNKVVPIRASHLLELSQALGTYINKRSGEWTYHYNFLGIMTFLYWLSDHIQGTDYFNIKSKSNKISAAKQLKLMIDTQQVMALEPAQQEALNSGRLGGLIKQYGGLEVINKELAHHSEQLKSLNHSL